MTLTDDVSRKNSYQIEIFELLDLNKLQSRHPDFYQKLDDMDVENCSKNDLISLSKDAPTAGASLYLLGKHLQRKVEHRI